MRKILIVMLMAGLIGCAGMKAKAVQDIIDEKGIHVSIDSEGKATIRRK